jgi:hypothetical protein
MTLHPYCNACGWRKGGVDSWNGRACKCGHSEPAIRLIDDQPMEQPNVKITNSGRTRLADRRC